jgi:hypothetical protein
MDPKLGAIPGVRFADEDEIHDKINTVAGTVGVENFYLNVGGTLFSAGAQIGKLQPDGVVVDSGENVEIKAGKYVREEVKETHKHKRSTINPCLGEAVAMLGQIDEFKEVRAKIDRIVPPKQVTDDALENLYAAIYDEKTQPQRLIEFIDTIKQADAQERKIIAEQKAKIAANKTYSPKIARFLETYAEVKLAELEFEKEVGKNSIPFFASILDAAAKYKNDAISGKQAAIEGLKNVAGDVAMMAATFGLIKGGTAAVRAGVKMVARGFKSTGIPTAQIKKLGLNVIGGGKGRINWNAEFKPRGLGYEDQVYKAEFSELTRTPINAETFDAFNFGTGHGVSIKSIKTTSPGYLADPRRVRYVIDSYIDDIVKFKGITRGQSLTSKVKPFDVTPTMVKSRELYIGIERETTLEQFLEIQKSAVQAKSNDIKFTLRIEE